MSVDRERRRFLVQATAIFAGCGGHPSSSPPTGACSTPGTGPGLGYCLVASQQVRFTGASRFGVGQVAIRLLDDNTGAILGRDNGGFYALSATCTHACCNVNVCADPSCTSVTVNAPACADPQPTTISPTGAAFLCPCHGSEYAADGTVLSGPARRSLPSVAATIEGEDVIVDLSRAVDHTTRAR